MDNQPAANDPARRSPGHLWPWIVVLLVLLFIGFIRFRLLDTPLERDEGEYAYAGQLILQGIPPYELAYNMKLPGTYYAYAVGMAIFGQTTQGVHLTLIAINSLTIVFVFLLARKLFGVVAGLVSCACYGLMSVSPMVLGMAAHATHFVVLFAVPATLVLLLAVEKKSQPMIFIAGLLYGLAFLMKQQGVFFIMFGGVYLLWQEAIAGSVFSGGFARKCLSYAGGVFLPFLMFCFACLVAGDFARFWFWTFSYAKSYADLVPLRSGVHLLGRHLQKSHNLSEGFWALAIVGLFLATFDKKLRGPMIFVLVLWLFSFCGTATTFYFRAHYFILILPAFAIMVGMAVAALQEVLRFQKIQNIFRGLPLLLFGLLFLWAVMYQWQFFFQLSPKQVIQTTYEANPFLEAVAVGDYLKTNSTPEAKIAVIGSEPEIYFYAQRHSATGYIYVYPLMEPQPAATWMQRDMIRDIETNQPEFIVLVSYPLSWLPYQQSSTLLFDWTEQYENNFYDQIGVIRNMQGQIKSIWGMAAKNADIRGECIIVYQRKPGTN